MEHHDLIITSSFILPLIIAITLHEAAHAFAANALGDPTARLQGRMSLDPIKHIDPFGTILLPGVLLLSGAPALGYAKPVPVHFDRLRHPRSGTILVALAGPGMNILLAFISALLMHLTPEHAPWTYANIVNSVKLNVLLAVFNMLPILPLDGGRVLGALLPPRLAALHARTERYGMLLVALLVILPGMLNERHIADIPIGYYLVGVPTKWLSLAILHLAGIGNG